MIYRFIIVLVAATFVSSFAFAQLSPPTKTAAVSPPAAAPSVAGVPTTRDGKPKARELRAACRREAEAKGLKDQEGRNAWIACYRAGRPDLAKRFDCRKEAKARGLSGVELEALLKACSAA